MFFLKSALSYVLSSSPVNTVFSELKAKAKRELRNFMVAAICLGAGLVSVLVGVVSAFIFCEHYSFWGTLLGMGAILTLGSSYRLMESHLRLYDYLRNFQSKAVESAKDLTTQIATQMLSDTKAKFFSEDKKLLPDNTATAIDTGPEPEPVNKKASIAKKVIKVGVDLLACKAEQVLSKKLKR